MFRRRKERAIPGLNTSSLPDLIFTVLFFFMIVTHMRKVTLKVQYRIPQGTELTRKTSTLRFSKVVKKRVSHATTRPQSTGQSTYLPTTSSTETSTITSGRWAKRVHAVRVRKSISTRARPKKRPKCLARAL